MHSPPRFLAADFFAHPTRGTATVADVLDRMDALDECRRERERQATAAPSAPPLRVPAERRRVARVRGADVGESGNG
jgi:hypothetical protein